MADQHSPTIPQTPSVAPEVPTHWATKVTDEIVDRIDAIKGKSTDKVVLVGKYVVYGLFAAIFGIFALIASAVMLVRLFVAFTTAPFVFGDGPDVWFAHLLVGGIFCLGGGLVWRMRPDLED